MENLILGLLILKKMTIYELNTSFKEGLSMIYSASYGSLQNAVKKLLKNESITYEEVVENGRNKKIYAINDLGIQAFFTWMNGPIPEKKLEIMILAKIYFLGLIETKENKIEIVDAMLVQTIEARNQLEQFESEITSIEMPEAYRKIANYQFKTLNYGVTTHNVAVDWLDSLKQDILNDKI